MEEPVIYFTEVWRNAFDELIKDEIQNMYSKEDEVFLFKCKLYSGVSPTNPTKV